MSVSFATTSAARATRLGTGLLALALLLSVFAVASDVASAAAAPNNNVIVKQSQNRGDPTSWLLVNGKRYWIPSGAIYNCLRAAGVSGPHYLTNAELDARPDQRGEHADCGKGNTPRGSFDTLSSKTPGTVHVRGWATDPNVRTAWVPIHVYIGGPAGTAGAEGHSISTGQTYRPDVNRVYPGDGDYHGFDSQIRTNKTGAQQVCAYAINLGPGGNNGLGCKTVHISSPNPKGSFDSLTSAGNNAIGVRGWAFDPNAPASKVTIHVYVGGKAGTPGAEGHNIGAAGVHRPDVGRAYPGVGDYHGFDRRIITNKTGNQQVCAYAINQGPGSNVLLGCKTVTVHSDPFALPAPYPAGTYAFPLNRGVCALVDQTGYPNNLLYNIFVFKSFTVTTDRAECRWLASTEGDSAGVPAGVIVPLLGIVKPAQACQWMTGEGAVVVGGEFRCLWTKSHYPTQTLTGQYR